MLFADSFKGFEPALLIGAEGKLAAREKQGGKGLLVLVFERQSSSEDLFVFLVEEEADKRIDIGEFRVIFAGILAVFLDI